MGLRQKTESFTLRFEYLIIIMIVFNANSIKKLIMDEKKSQTVYKVLTFSSIDEIRNWLDIQRKAGKSIGFVPTMGALHRGHTSLIEKAKTENDIVAASIFVNPTQFNNPADLQNYPRTPEEDYRLLLESHTDVLFSPSVDEVYSPKLHNAQVLDIGQLGTVMEGEHRPGHFAGVIQIVSRLFDIINPDSAYFGEKDFQQLAVIRFMTKQMNYKIEIIGCPTVRESTGLAMSSRNLRLTEKGRVDASEIYTSLLSAKAQYKKSLPVLIKQHVVSSIEKDGNLKVEYIEIADEETLQPVSSWDQHQHCRIFAAVFCEGIRLIDNVRLF